VPRKVNFAECDRCARSARSSLNTVSGLSAEEQSGPRRHILEIHIFLTKGQYLSSNSSDQVASVRSVHSRSELQGEMQ
jgi:hypothetical protein